MSALTCDLLGIADCFITTPSGLAAAHSMHALARMSVVLILLAVCCMILGATAPKPAGWAVLALALIALLVHVLRL